VRPEVEDGVAGLQDGEKPHQSAGQLPLSAHHLSSDGIIEVDVDHEIIGDVRGTHVELAWHNLTVHETTIGRQ
jgi:hypothetical protein